MIKNGVLTVRLGLRVKNYMRAFWYEMHEMVLNIC